MPTQLEEATQNYWAPDREEQLARLRTEQDAVQNYWAPDRAQYLGNLGLSDPNIPVNLPPVQQLPGYNNSGPPPWWGGNTGFAGGGMSGGGGGGPFDYNAFRRRAEQLGGQYGGSLQDFVTNIYPQLAQEFPGIQQFGSKGDKIRLPNGQTIDAVISAGLGGRGYNWSVERGGGGAGGGGYGSSFFGQAPNATPFSYAPFQAPTGLDYQNDPGYQERLRLGTDAIQKSAAAKGTLLTGGTLKDLNDYAQTFASNEFGNVFNRALQGYQTNFNTAFEPWKQNYQNAYQSWLGNFQAANQQWQNELAGNQQRFNQLFNTAGLSQQATNQLANYGGQYGNQLSNVFGNYGNNMADLYTQQGNARAGGQAASGGAWGNAFNNAGNSAMAGYYMNQYGQPGTTPVNYAGGPMQGRWVPPLVAGPGGSQNPGFYGWG